MIPNPNCPWVTTQEGVKYKVQSVGYVPAELTQGRIGLYVYAVHKKFQVWGEPYDLVLPGSVDHYATLPQFVIDMAGGNFDPAHGAGPFTIKMGDCTVSGMGLPLNRHVCYVVTFLIAE